MSHCWTRLQTHINDSSTAVQVLVQVVQHLPQLLHVLLVGLEQHGLEVHWQPVSVKHHSSVRLFKKDGRMHTRLENLKCAAAKGRKVQLGDELGARS